MNREIKFRLWNPEAKVLTGGNELNTILLTTNGEFIKEFNRCKMVWMQYTGLKDKKGIEIYEGDIVRSDSNKDGIVNFKSGCFMWRNEFLADNPECSNEMTWGNVIGNIYQNPELLENVQK